MPQPVTSPPTRKRGQPARLIPRTRTLPRVTEATYAILAAYADKHGLYLADAIEHAAAQLANRS
jgi:hypothetical protein